MPLRSIEMILNPLHTCVFATRLADGVPFDKVAERFGAINAMLDRNHMVTTLCVLDAGTAWYSVESGRPYEADFMTDHLSEMFHAYGSAPPERRVRCYPEAAFNKS